MYLINGLKVIFEYFCAVFFQDQAIKDLNLETVKVLQELNAEILLDPSIVISVSSVMRKNIIVLLIVKKYNTYIYRG